MEIPAEKSIGKPRTWRVAEMRTPRATSSALSWCPHLICICLLIFSQLGILSAQQGKPLNEAEVVALLQNGVSNSRIAALVEEKGINFEVTEAIVFYGDRF